MAQELTDILKGQGPVQEELNMRSYSVETLDFEKALVDCQNSCKFNSPTGRIFAAQKPR